MEIAYDQQSPIHHMRQNDEIPMSSLTYNEQRRIEHDNMQVNDMRTNSFNVFKFN